MKSLNRSVGKSLFGFVLTGIFTLSVLTACGAETGQGSYQEAQEWSAADSEYSWKVREKVSMPEDTTSSRLALTSEACYELNTETGVLYEFKPDEKTYQTLSLTLGENAHILYFGASGDSALEIITIDEEGQTQLTECDTGGKILAQADIPDGLITGNSVDQVLSDDGCWYLLSYGNAARLEADGTGKVLSDLEFRSLVRLADGVCFLADENGETDVYRMNDAQTLTLWETVPAESGLAVTGEDQESIVLVNSGISRIAFSGKTLTNETELVSIGITENTVKQLALGEDCIRLLRYVEGSYQIATLEKTDATDTRQVVKLLTWSDGFYNLEEKVIQFNEENEQYRIEIINLSDDDTASSYFYPDHEDSMRELQLLMESGEVPDLVDASVFYDWRDYARKGYLEELDEYIADSNVISRDYYLENLYAAGTENGKTYFVPYSFRVKLYWGKTEAVGENAGWTLTELLDCSDAHSEVGVFNADPATSLEVLLTMSLSEFVDADSQSCDFETELFYRLLEKCRETAYQPYEGDDADNTVYTELAENKCLLEWLGVSNPEEILVYNAEWDIGGEENTPLQIKGYPTSDGNCSGEATLTHGSYFVIPAKAQQKDGAWAFIEAYHSEYDTGFRYLQWAIPARKDWLETRMENIISITVEGVKIEEGYVMTEEERALFREIAESARVLTADEEQILEIISEEAPAYFNGDKSAQDVAAIIQSRVGLFLKEN